MRLALAGKTCSGKDAVAAALHIPRFSFADGMKDEIAALLTLKGVTTTREMINADKARYRSILQVYGTEVVRRFIDDDYWIKRCLAQLPKDICADVVVTDVRFPNEVNALMCDGFTVVRLDVSRDAQIQRYQAAHGAAPEVSQFAHVSETALDSYSFIHRINADLPLAAVVAQINRLWAR